MSAVRLFDWSDGVVTLWQSWCAQATVSPFQTPEYLQTFTRHFISLSDLRLVVVEVAGQPHLIMPLVAHHQRLQALGMQPVLGGQEVTDLSAGICAPGLSMPEQVSAWQSLVSWAQSQGYQGLQLDYVLDSSSTQQALNLVSGLMTGVTLEARFQEVSPILSLPESWESYVQSLKKKYRDELKRKLKRLHSAQPEFELAVTALTQDMVEFIALHRLAAGDKEQFMTPAMAEFFSDLARQKYSGGWAWQLAFISLHHQRVGAVAYFINQDALLLYNSGYNPEFRSLGVGFGLVAELVRYGITTHRQTLDFLRGSERYKYELGAVDQYLQHIAVSW